VIVEGASVKSRLLSPRETGRLMGLPEDYQLPSNTNEAYGLTGDGVVVFGAHPRADPWGCSGRLSVKARL